MQYWDQFSCNIIIEGVLPDFVKRGLAKSSKFDFFASFPPKELGWNHISMKFEQFFRKSRRQDLIQQNSLWSNETQHKHALLANPKKELTAILENKLFMFISSDMCHKKILLGSLSIPLTLTCPRVGWGRCEKTISWRRKEGRVEKKSACSAPAGPGARTRDLPTLKICQITRVHYFCTVALRNNSSGFTHLLHQ